MEPFQIIRAGPSAAGASAFPSFEPWFFRVSAVLVLTNSGFFPLSTIFDICIFSAGWSFGINWSVADEEALLAVCRQNRQAQAA